MSFEAPLSVGGWPLQHARELRGCCRPEGNPQDEAVCKVCRNADEDEDIQPTGPRPTLGHGEPPPLTMERRRQGVNTENSQEKKKRCGAGRKVKASESSVIRAKGQVLSPQGTGRNPRI